jgi:hypothetical protein
MSLRPSSGSAWRGADPELYTRHMIQSFLVSSRATDAFRDAVAALLASGAPNDRIRFDHRSPPVKVARVITNLLQREPELVIDGVEIKASSGCEYYRGDLRVELAGGEHREFRFDWDCRWRAEEQGWTDHFGFPDQIRAAQEFGHDCFRVWERTADDERAA